MAYILYHASKQLIQRIVNIKAMRKTMNKFNLSDLTFKCCQNCIFQGIGQGNIKTYNSISQSVNYAITVLEENNVINTQHNSQTSYIATLGVCWEANRIAWSESRKLVVAEFPNMRSKIH